MHIYSRRLARQTVKGVTRFHLEAFDEDVYNSHILKKLLSNIEVNL